MTSRINIILSKNIVLLITLLIMISKDVFAQQKEHNLTSFKSEVEKASAYFEERGEVKKNEALTFLAENIDIHFSNKCIWVDEDNESIGFNEFDFPDYETALQNLEYLKKNKKINYFLEKTYDYSHLDSKFLINIIDEAYDQWQCNPWSSNYDFETFCEYILPYRNGSEPLTKNWQNNYRAIFEGFSDFIIDENDPIDVNAAVLQTVKHFQFILRDPFKQPLLSAEQLLFRRKGTCLNLAHAAVLITRANGLATTIDYTPYHAASSGRHYWNTVMDKDGIHFPFNGTGNAMYAGERGKRLGKALRRTFSKQKEVLVNYIPEENAPSVFLGVRNYIDVTDEYVEVTDVKYKFREKPKNSIGFLMVYNRGYWRPYWWGKSTIDGMVTYKKMGKNLVYLPAQTQEKKELLRERYPIHVDEEGRSTVLKPDFSKTFQCNISRENEVVLMSQDNNSVELYNGFNFTLSYWDGQWKRMGTQKVKDKSLFFDKLPKNALFQLLPDNPDGFERIFILNPNTCKVAWF